MKTYILIPARLNSKRLYRKMLLDETGTSLIKHTYDNVSHLIASKNEIDGAFVVTPDDEISDLCEDFNIPVIRVREHTLCGTHSCVLAARQLGFCNIINLQGDCPSIDAGLLSRMAEYMYKRHEMCSAYYVNKDKEFAEKPENVKVVSDECQYANYFSRAMIPYGAKIWHFHIGVYGFPHMIHQNLLIRYENVPRQIYKSSMEGENLEQLMWLQMGKKIKMLESKPCIGIDTREDYEQFKKNCNGE